MEQAGGIQQAVPCGYAEINSPDGYSGEIGSPISRRRHRRRTVPADSGRKAGTYQSWHHQKRKATAWNYRGRDSV